MIPFNITSHFFEVATNMPSKIALRDGRNTLTYGELARKVNLTANYYKHKGINCGDRVLVFVPMSINLYVVVLALFKIGAAVVFIDRWANSQRLEASCRIARCKGVVGGFKVRLLKFFLSSLRKIPLFLRTHGTFPDSTDFSVPATGEDDVALITLTTGSTGEPKAAIRTHGLLNRQFEALRSEVKPAAADVDLSLLPIVLLMNLGVGATSVIVRFTPSKPKSFDAVLVSDEVQRCGVTRITASPYFLSLLATEIKRHPQKSTTVKRIITGGAPVFPQQAAQITAAFNNAELLILYGSTEAEPISSISGNELLKRDQLHKGLAVGKPCDSAEVNIIASTQEAVTGDDLVFNQPGVPGEIIVAGPHVLRTYLNNDKAVSRNKIFAGTKVYHRTGDCGYLDAENNLFLCGRCETVINYQGMPIFPFLYEERLALFPGVTIGTIMQIKNRILIIAEADKDKEKMILDFFSNEPFPISRVVTLPALPRDPRHFSKIDYTRLKKLISRL